MQRRSNVGMQRETCCIICDLRIGVIVLAITGMIESGQQILVTLALALSHSSENSDFPASNQALLHVYIVFQVISFISILFGLFAVVSQGRQYRKALLSWILSSFVISIIQIVYLFYVIAYFNKRTMSLIAATLVLCFVPKNAFFATIVYKYYKLVAQGLYTPDYDEIDFSKETIRRSRAGSSRRDSVNTLKEGPFSVSVEPPLKAEIDAKPGRKTSSNFVLKVIPELSESKEASFDSTNDNHEDIYDMPISL